MRTFSYLALALSTALAGPAAAQYRPPAAPPQTTADQLSAVMRRVAAAPTDVYALLSAGELSVKLDDMSAAAAFFARVEKIDPRNGRAKAGMAAILVRAERPGEALRYFQQAEALGHPANRFASDRGLALDLLGEQERAQRDYRLALRATADDETVRRYALSLGISGRQALALEQLEPLIKRQDRAAWRVRAFVLAMNGDVAGASTIAVTMMPPGMAGGLQPFLERLPSLPAADRAFAVHFGEVRPTPARLADARLKPGLAPLGPDPFPPVQVAARAAPPVALASRGDRRRGRARVERREVALVVPRTVVPVVARANPVPVTPRVVASPVPSAVIASSPVETRRVPVAVSIERRREPAVVAAAAPESIDSPAYAALQALAQTDGAEPSRVVAPAAVQLASVRPGVGATPQPVGTASAPVPTAALPATTPPILPSYSLPAMVASTSGTTAPVRVAGAPTLGDSSPVVGGPAAATPTASVGTTAGAPVPGFGVDRPVQLALAPWAVAAPVASTAPGGTAEAGAASPGFASLASAPPAAAPPTPIELAAAPVTAVRSEDSILARIVASITIPGAELGVAQPERRLPVAAAIEPAAARVLAAGAAKAASQASDRAAAVRTIATASKKPAAPPKSVKRKGDATGPADDAATAGRARRGRGELAASDEAGPATKPKTAAEKRAADRKKAADDKAALAKAEAAKAKGDPERIWVQVAGGASEDDLPRAWSAAQKKSAALKGRTAYVTPLRATNRVVTGPFKTDAEARAFVNQLAKQGVSAFQFTSATGQKMTKLSAR